MLDNVSINDYFIQYLTVFLSERAGLFPPSGAEPEDRPRVACGPHGRDPTTAGHCAHQLLPGAPTHQRSRHGQYLMWSTSVLVSVWQGVVCTSERVGGSSVY